MNILIIARHGSYEKRDDGYRLSWTGERQIEALAAALKPTIEGRSVSILTSTAPRALDSAKLLGEKLGITPEPHELLWSENSRPVNIDGALALIQANEGSEVVVLMTHLEYSMSLPGRFAKQALGSDEGFNYRQTSYAEAWVVDCDLRTFTHLQPRV